MPVGVNSFDETVWPYVDGYPDDFHDSPKAMGCVLWQVLLTVLGLRWEAGLLGATALQGHPPAPDVGPGIDDRMRL